MENENKGLGGLWRFNALWKKIVENNVKSKIGEFLPKLKNKELLSFRVYVRTVKSQIQC